jgi:hypothetical protein
MNYSIEIFLSDFKAEFPNFTIDFISQNIGGENPLFFISVDTAEQLKTNWKSIRDYVAVNFQAHLEDEFSVWNLYIFFLSAEEIENDLKYIIENDTFSSRKLVISPTQDIESILKTYVLNMDLLIKPTKKLTEISFEKNPIIWDQLSKLPSKQKMSEEHTKSLEKIISQLKLQDHEI